MTYSLNKIYLWFKVNSLIILNKDKTNVNLNVKLKQAQLDQVSSAKCLRIYLKSEMTWINEIQYLCKQLYTEYYVTM